MLEGHTYTCIVQVSRVDAIVTDDIEFWRIHFEVKHLISIFFKSSFVYLADSSAAMQFLFITALLLSAVAARVSIGGK